MFRDRLRRRRTLAPELAAALGDLDRLTASRPELAPAGKTLARVLRAAFGVGDEPPAALDPGRVSEQAGEAASRGQPVFRIAVPPLDDRTLLTRASGIARAIGSRELIRWLRENPSRFVTRCRQEVVGEKDFALDPAGPDHALLASVVRLTLLPTLAHSSAVYEPIIEARGGTGPVCPCCGEWALLAESRGLERRRFLRCGRCALGWPMPRLGCPSCGPGPGPDRAMVSRSFEGQSERYWLLSCGLCGLRLKVLATLDRLTPPGLLVAELATLHLDQIPEAN